MLPRARVAAFIADFEAVHAKTKPLFDTDYDLTDGFDAWATALEKLSAKHGTASLRVPPAFTETPAHSGTERILGDEETGDGVRVSTINNGFHYEYDLIRSAEAWRIQAIRGYQSPPEDPAVDPAEAGRLARIARPDATLVEAAGRGDMGALFRETTFVDDDDEEVTVTVEPLGTFHTSSGVLAIGDLGDDLAGFGVLERMVPPATCEVEVSRAYDRIAALRIRLSPGEPADWRSAATSDGDTYPVDAGNLAVVDWLAASSLTTRDKEGLFATFADRADSHAMILTGPDGVGFGVMASSGWGDGSYPAYWGVDGEGEPVQLVVDFGVIPGADWADQGQGDELWRPWQGDHSAAAIDTMYSGRLWQHYAAMNELPELGESDRPDPASLFEDPVTIGRLEISEGVLVAELGGEFAKQLPVPLSPGTYVAEASMAHRRVAGLRLLKEGSSVDSWRLAATAGDHEVFVSQAKLAVFPWRDARVMTLGDQTSLYERAFAAGQTFTSDDPRSVVVTTGWGSGVYPVYVGLDADGRRVAIVADFGVIAGAPWADGD